MQCGGHGGPLVIALLYDELVAKGHTEQDILIEGNKGSGGPQRDRPLGEENLNRLLAWLLQWRRGLLSRGQGDERPAGGGHAELRDHDDRPEPRGDRQVRFALAYNGSEGTAKSSKKRVWIVVESLWLGECGDASDEEFGELELSCERSFARAGGVSRTARNAPAKVREILGDSIIAEQSGALPPFDGGVGTLVEDWIEQNLCGYLRDSASKQNAGVYGKWRAWAKRQGWPTEYLNKADRTEENEDKLLGFLGYLGWLGCSVATIKQAVFAIKGGHKRHGHGDPTERMYRLWMLVGALDCRSPKKPRRLGVTPDMLKWIGRELANDGQSGSEAFDGAMLWSALLTAWFYMLRAKEYCDSNGVDYMMILRGADLKFVQNADGEDGEVVE